MHRRPPMCTTDRYAAQRRGFSLIELMAAMAVLAILSALALPASSKVRRRFSDATVLSDVLNAGKALAGTDGNASFARTVSCPSAASPSSAPGGSRG